MRTDDGTFKIDSLYDKLEFCLQIAPNDDPKHAFGFSGEEVIAAFVALDLPGAWTQAFDDQYVMLGRGGADPTTHFVIEPVPDVPDQTDLLVWTGDRSRLLNRKANYDVLMLVFTDSPVRISSGAADGGGRGSPAVYRKRDLTPTAIVANLKDAADKLRAALGIASAIAPA